MAHEIEQVGSTALAVFNRLPAWHRLGTVFDEAPSVQAAIEAAHLGGWNVRTVPLITTRNADDSIGIEDHGVDVPSHRAIVRTNPINGGTDILGVMGKDFVPVQNEAAFEFAQNILDVSDVRVEAAGSLREGKRVWMLLRVPDEVVVGDGDKTYPYLLVANGHDGSLALTVKFTAVRVVCANTLAMSLGKDSGVSFRHTKNVTNRIDAARKALQVAYSGMEALQDEAQRLLDIKVSGDKWDRFVNTLMPLPDFATATPQAMSRRINQRDSLRNVYEASTQDGIRGTAWGAYNAAVEWSDFYASDKPNVLAQRAVRNATDIWKRDAHKAALALA